MNPSVTDFFDAVRSWGAGDVAVSRPGDGPAGLPFAVSLALRLSDAVIDEIDDEPTYTYFHHYRTANAFLDRLALQAGLYLQGRGARYLPVAASQSAPDSGADGAFPYGGPFAGRYSHKKAACLSGLGAMGRSNLFLHRQWGPRVRLVTVFTDWKELEALCGSGSETGGAIPDRIGPALSPRCAGCERCVAACPALAIGHSPDGPVFDPAKCSAWMKKEYRHIGRGAVCGICMRVCPSGAE